MTKLMELFLAVFPHGCHQYEGPNTLMCYISVWNSVGCTEKGWKYPEVASSAQLFAWDTLSLPLVS